MKVPAYIINMLENYKDLNRKKYSDMDESERENINLLARMIANSIIQEMDGEGNHPSGSSREV